MRKPTISIVASNNRTLTVQDLSSFNGARIGVNKGSVQEGFLSDWAEKNQISIEIEPLAVSESESMEMVETGQLDGYATIYSLGSEEKTIPLCRIGESQFFYAVNKNRPDLLAELNMALAGIQDEDPYFNQKISQEHHYNTTKSSLFLTPDQEAWIKTHGTVRVGGDEFIALLEGEDYPNQENLLKQFEKQIMDNKKEDKIVVAFGSSRFDPDRDESIITVFERADENMYQKKKELKNTPSKAA